jgi:hypothetical protein
MLANQVLTDWLAIHQAVGLNSAMQGWLYALSVGRNYLLSADEWAVLGSNSRQTPVVPACLQNTAISTNTRLELRQQLPRNSERFVIVGGGPVGLMLAVALKKLFGSRIVLHVLENRVNSEGQGTAFTRSWPINIPVSEFMFFNHPSGINSVAPLGEYLPWTLRELESHLLSLAQILDCQFVYSNEKTENLLLQLQPDLVFDATGGRWRAKGQMKKECEVVLCSSDLETVQGYCAFGVNPVAIAPRDARNLAVSVYDNGDCRPTLNGVPLSSWMLKIRGIPRHLGPVLIEKIRTINHDNWIYVWPTHLSSGEWIAFFGLRQDDAWLLQNEIKDPLSLDQVWDNLSKLSDPRWKIIVDVLASGAVGHHSECRVDPPFLWAPHLYIGDDSGWSHQQGVPVIPVGDSLFHGHPQVGNGLGSHLNMINLLIQQLQRSNG